MRVVVQRVTRADVLVDGVSVGRCGAGIVVLLGVAAGDTAAEADTMALRVSRLRIFEDEHGKFDRSLVDVGGEALVVSQFTLIADTSKGRRPSFAGAAPPELARPVYERFCASLEDQGVRVATGVFGARMSLELVNDGPVTIVLDTDRSETDPAI